MLTQLITAIAISLLNPTGCATVDATRLAGTIYAEARGEAAEGQIAVAWVVRLFISTGAGGLVNHPHPI